MRCLASASEGLLGHEPSCGAQLKASNGLVEVDLKPHGGDPR